MGKQRAADIKPVDYLPDINNVVVPDDVKKVMTSRGMDPVEWETKLNSRIAEGGSRKREALEAAFPTFDKILGGNRYSTMLNNANTAETDHRSDVNTRRAERSQRLQKEQTAFADETKVPGTTVVPNAEIEKTSKPVEQVSALQAFFGPMHNAVLSIGEGALDFANGANYLINSIAGNLAGDDKFLEFSESNYKNWDKAINKGTNFMSVYVDPETSRSPVSLSTDKKGELSVDWSAAKDYKKWFAGVGSGVGSLVPGLLAGGGSASLFMSFAQMYSANQDDATAAGLKGNEVFAYATGTSAAGAVLELIGQRGILDGISGKSGNEVIKQIVKDKSTAALEKLSAKGITPEIFDDVLGKTVRETLKELKDKSLVDYYSKFAGDWIAKSAKQAAPEAATEFIQEWANYGSKRLWNGTASGDRQEGEGAFKTDAWETAGNAAFGGMLGGFLGKAIGSLHSNPNPKELHETIGAYVNADIKSQLAKNPNATFEDIIQGNQFNKVLNAATKSAQFNNPDGTVNTDKVNDVLKKSQAIYKTYFDFKDLPNFTANDKLAMFNITDVRNQNLNQRNQFDELASQLPAADKQISDMKSAGNYDPSELIKLEAQRATISDQLGPQNPETGRYIADEKIETENNRMENVISQAVPEISSSDDARKAMGRSFLNSNITAFRNPNFKADAQIVLPNGLTVVRDNNTTAIRKVTTTPVKPDSDMRTQLNSGTYEPITRYEKSFDPIDDYQSYSAAATSIATNQTTKVSDASRSPYDFKADATDLITEISKEAQVLQTNPDVYEQVKGKSEQAYHVYNQIVAQDAKSDSPSLLPMTQEEFNNAIGFELQETPAQLEEEPIPVITFNDDIEPVSMESMKDKPVIYNGVPGVLKKDGVRYVVETDNNIFELAESGDSANINDYGIKENIKTEKYKVSFLADNQVKVNGVNYTVNNNANGNVESISPENNPTQKITNEPLLIAVEIERSKSDFNELLNSPEIVNEQYAELVQAPNFENTLVDGIFVKNFNESVDTALQKLENGEDLSEKDKLALDLWSTEAYLQIENLREKMPDSDVFQNASDYFELVNEKLNPNGKSVSSQGKPGVQNSVSDGSTSTKKTRQVGKKTPKTDRSKLNKSNGETSENASDEDSDSAGDSSVATEPRDIKAEYTAAAELAGPIESAQSEADGVLENAGRSIEATETAIETGKDGDVARAIDAAGQLLQSIERSNGQTEELSGKLDPEPDEDSGDSGTSQEPASTDETVISEADPVEEKQIIKSKTKGIPKSQREIKNPDRIKALNKFPNNIYDEVYQYFIGNGQVTPAAIQDLTKGSANSERQSMVTITASAEKGGLGVDQLAHKLWEESNFDQKYDTADYKTAIEETIGSFPGIKELTDRVNSEPNDSTVDTTEQNNIDDSDVEQSNVSMPVDNTFADNLAKSEEDPDYVPFSEDNSNAPIKDAETKAVLGRLSQAFPNIAVTIAPTVDEYVNALNSVTDAKSIYTPDNVPYGFINPQNGAIYLDPSRLNTNTAIHEFGHIWTMWAKNNNPELYQKGIDLVKDSNYYSRLSSNPAYKGLSNDFKLDEALSTAIGDRGDSFRIAKRKGTFKDWMNSVFKKVKYFLGIKEKSPEKIANMTLKDFTNSVVKDLTSGKEISPITSQQISEIMASENAVVQESIESQGSDPLMHSTPATFALPGSGEYIGTLADLKDEAIKELTAAKIIDKTAQKLTETDKTEIAAIADRYGWTFQGKEMVTDPATGMKIPHLKFKNDISTQRNSFFVRGKQMVTIPLRGKAGKEGRVAAAISETESWLNGLKNKSVFFKTGQAILDSGLDGLTNLETLVKILDSSDGILHTLIHDVKREASNNRNDALNIMARSYESFRRSMGKYSTHNGMNSLQNVEKFQINPLQWNRKSGQAESRTMHVPVAVAMNLVASHETQISMGAAYNTREVTDASGTKRTEIHTSLVIDSHYSTDPTDSTLFFKQEAGKENIHKGFHFKKDVAMDEKDGEFEPLQDGRQYGIFEQNEMDRLVDYFNTSGPKEIRENYQKIKQAFNDPSIRQKLKEENDDAINPGEPFTVIKDYSPLQVVNTVSAQDKVNSFAPNLEDSKQLNNRTSRPDAIFAEDIVDSYDYYKDAVGHILGSTKLVHNLKNLQQAIISDYDGPLQKRINDILGAAIENLQNFRQSQWKISKFEKELRPLLTLMGKYTAFTFRGNLGISTKQIGTWFSALGMGYIDNSYLMGKGGAKMLYMAFRGSTTDRFAKGTIIEDTGEGLKTSLGYKTAEADLILELTGENITDPVKKAEHRRIWATVIQRAIYGSSQYTEAADLGKLKFSKTGAAKFKQHVSKYDEFWEERGMSSIRKLDRAVILGYMDAAKRQVADEVASGKTKAADANKRAADLTTETLYLTNQMNDPADLTMLQRNQSFAKRIISVYSGQTQKLWNQLAGSTIEYYKRKDSAPASEVAQLKKRMQWSLASNLVVNTLWMAGVNAAASVMRGFLSGGDDREDWYYTKKAGFDVARYVAGIAPGLSSNVVNYLISMIDNEKWEDEIFDIPGSDLIKNAFDFSKDIIGIGEAKIFDEDDDEKMEKLYTGAIYNFSKIFGVSTGTPKAFIDPMAKQINAQIKTPKGLKSDDIQLEGDNEEVITDEGGDEEAIEVY